MNNGVNIYQENGRKIIKGLGFHKPLIVKDLKELVRNSVTKYGKKAAFKYKVENEIKEISYEQFGSDVDCAGTALVNLGLKGKKIAIISENRYEWAVSYYSIVNGTGVVVPLDKYLPMAEVENLVVRGEIEAIFYSDSFSKIMQDLSQKLPQLKLLINMDDQESSDNNKFISLKDLLSLGEKLIQKGDRSFIDAEIDRDAMNILLFTSGTTSMSKGVMLSHANIASNVTGVTTMIKTYDSDIYLSLLPLHHTFENTIGMNFMLHTGVTIAYCQGIRHISQNIQEFEITILVAVPAIMEAIYKRLMEQIEKSGKMQLVKRLIKVSDFLRKFNIDLRRKLFSSIFEKLGPNLRLAVSGAAPMSLEVILGFDKIGLEIIQGYGLTETSPVLTANNDVFNIYGTVGCPMYDIELSIDSPDESGMGEIIARGPNIMSGYYNDEEATKEAFTEDGWFKTGDLGIMDKEGNLKITGRAKSMIVLTNGKKAFPEEYENILNSFENVKESFVWGNTAPDGDIQVCGCIVVEKELIENINGVPALKEEIRKKIENSIKEMNKNLPQYKILRYLVFTSDELIKTTTLKIKRKPQYEAIKKWLDKHETDMRKASSKVIEFILPFSMG